MENVNRITFNKIVNVNEDLEITLLQGVFKYIDGSKGATGSKFYPVSEAEYKKNTTLKAIKEKLQDCIAESDMTESYHSMAKDIKDSVGAEHFMFDTSYSDLWDYIRNELNLSKKEAYIFECTGGGRCFDKDYVGNYSESLSELIRSYETPD